MSKSLVMTILGPDRPGLVEALSATIADHEGSWLESRMAQMAGHFTGILRVEVPAENADALLNALRNLGTAGLTVHAVEETSPSTTRDRCLRFDIMGNDRPGIIKEVAAAIAEAGGNVALHRDVADLEFASWECELHAWLDVDPASVDGSAVSTVCVAGSFDTARPGAFISVTSASSSSVTSGPIGGVPDTLAVLVNAANTPTTVQT